MGDQIAERAIVAEMEGERMKRARRRRLLVHAVGWGDERKEGRKKGIGSFLGTVPPVHQLPAATPHHTHTISISAANRDPQQRSHTGSVSAVSKADQNILEKSFSNRAGFYSLSFVL